MTTLLLLTAIIVIAVAFILTEIGPTNSPGKIEMDFHIRHFDDFNKKGPSK